MSMQRIRFVYLILALALIVPGANPQATVSAAADYELLLPVVRYTDPNTIWASDEWSMAGANPERTSWTKSEVRGALYPQWYRPIEAYIPGKVQIVTAQNNLYISTARGLLVLNAKDGSDRWVFPTELPLGHTPTVVNNVVYVGGMDKKMYALNAQNGALLWSYTAGAGFDTNPLVYGGMVYAGNRDGYFYAIHASGPNTGKLAWRYKTGGPIHFSAAYKEGVVYFASDDSYAYALNAHNGALVWRSVKLPGAGFHSWWPVVYQNYVIFAGSSSYRTSTAPWSEKNREWIAPMDRDEVFTGYANRPDNSPLSPMRADGTMDVSRIMDYFEAYPHRRTFFLLNRYNGTEVTFDTDNDGRHEYAPFLWFGTHSGNRYPPAVSPNGTLYQSNVYASSPYGIMRGQVTGWNIGSDSVSIPTSSLLAVDEPIAYAGGGNVIHYNLCCDRASGAFDMSTPNTGRDPRREWAYFEYNLAEKIPGYNTRYYAALPDHLNLHAAFGSVNGVYGIHGDQNPPIPYQGMVYMHRGNAIIGFGSTQRQPAKLPMVVIQPPAKTQQPVNRAQLTQTLEAEVRKMINAGHLRPGYGISGNFDQAGNNDCGQTLADYYSSPADNITTLLMTLPYLSADLRAEARAYIQKEFNAYPPYKYYHNGWQSGAAREPFIMAPEVNAGRAAFGPSEYTIFKPWMSPNASDGFPPHAFYALWKYAQEFGGARALYDSSRSKLTNPPPTDAVLAQYPGVHNAYIAGYTGFLNLEKLAGVPETSSVRNQLNRLLALRSSQFRKDSIFEVKNSCRALNTAQNFMYLTPELGNHLRADPNTLAKVQAAVTEYNNVAPYWFVTKFEGTYAEGAIHHLYDYQAGFQARALILKEPAGELIKYLDVPGFPIGDLYYIQNLVYLLQAP